MTEKVTTKTTEKLLNALDSNDPEVCRAAARNRNATPEILMKALDSKDNDVRHAATWNPNATPEVLLKALEDENKWVRREAVYHPNFKTLTISDEQWFSLIVKGLFDGFAIHIPPHIKRNPRYKSIRLLLKLAS
jgi:HEAT repeat protein